MQQIAYLPVLPLLIERRITRQQNIAVAFNYQPQFLVNDAVNGLFIVMYVVPMRSGSSACDTA